jgi:inhibitor of cysteine peptidase
MRSTWIALVAGTLVTATSTEALPRALAQATAPQQPAAQEKAAPARIDLRKSDSYKSGRWEYRFELTNPGTRSEGRWGWLMFDGQRLPPARVNDFYETPWGPLYWVGSTTETWGSHGWLPVVVGSQPKGKQLVDPANTMPTVVVTKADAGRTIALTRGAILGVRLDGNPTTGFRWRQAAMEGDALSTVGEPQYAARRPDDILGAGGSFVFRYRGDRPGKSTIRFVYARPWEVDKEAETFVVTIEVKAAAEPPAKAGDG